MALTQVTPFQAKVLRGMRAEGLSVKRIVRIYPPLDSGWPSEVLFISSDNRAGTCYVDSSGGFSAGPFAGFGVPEAA